MLATVDRKGPRDDAEHDPDDAVRGDLVDEARMVNVKRQDLRRGEDDVCNERVVHCGNLVHRFAGVGTGRAKQAPAAGDLGVARDPDDFEGERCAGGTAGDAHGHSVACGVGTVRLEGHGVSS